MLPNRKPHEGSLSLFGAIQVQFRARITLVWTGDVDPVGSGSGKVFARINVENRNQTVELHYGFVDEPLESGGARGCGY